MKKFLLVTIVTALNISSIQAITLNVRDFTKKGSNILIKKKAIQTAIDSCSKQGGGTIYFPAGEYISGSINLKSNITLHFESGAILKASSHLNDYNDPANAYLLVAQNAEYISITGDGIIYGNGVDEYIPDIENSSFRTGAILFNNCEHIKFRDITILYTTLQSIHLEQCNIIHIDGVTINNDISDGIYLNCCRNVNLSNCHMEGGDIAIHLEADEPLQSCENIHISNSIFQTMKTALKFGESSWGDFKDIHFSNCTIRNTEIGVGFNLNDGGAIERVSVSDVSIETNIPDDFNVKIYPILINIEKQFPDSKIGKIQDISFHDIKINSGSKILVQGILQSPVENLTIHNVTFRVNNSWDFSNKSNYLEQDYSKNMQDTLYARLPSYITFAHINGLSVDNISVAIDTNVYKQFDRAVIAGRNIQDGYITHIRRLPSDIEESMPIVDLSECHNLLFTDLKNSRLLQRSENKVDIKMVNRNF